MENEALKALVTEVIFKSIDEKKREELLKNAIASLLEEKPKTYGYGTKSALQEAFDMAIYNVARDLVKEHVQTNAEWRANLQKVVNAAFDRVMGNERNREDLITSIASAISNAFTPRN